MARLLFACASDTWGGVEKNVLLRVRHLSERGHAVTVLLVQNSFEDRFRDLPGVRLVTVPRRFDDRLPGDYRRAFRILRQTRPDGVFVALKRDWWLFAVVSRWVKPHPRVILYLGIKRRIRLPFKYRLMIKRWGSRVLVNSRELQQHLLDRLPFLTTEQCRVVYNGFDLPPAEAPYTDLRQSLGLPTDAKLVGCAGRLSRQKGFDLLPAILSSTESNVQIVIAGEGDQRDALETQFADAGVSERIHFLGRTHDMDGFYRSIDLFLLCSRNEGMANVLNEALSYGLPVVATRAPGSAELLEDGKYGILAPIGDTGALARGLDEILTGNTTFPADRQRSRIRDRFSVRQMIDGTEEQLLG